MFVPMYALLQEIHLNMIPAKPANSGAGVIICKCKHVSLSIQQTVAKTGQRQFSMYVVTKFVFLSH